MHCRDCRFSEGHAQERGGVYWLVLWCLAKGARAIEVCGNYAPAHLSNPADVRDAYETTEQQAARLEGRE